MLVLLEPLLVPDLVDPEPDLDDPEPDLLEPLDPDLLDPEEPDSVVGAGWG